MAEYNLQGNWLGEEQADLIKMKEKQLKEIKVFQATKTLVEHTWAIGSSFSQVSEINIVFNIIQGSTFERNLYRHS